MFSITSHTELPGYIQIALVFFSLWSAVRILKQRDDQRPDWIRFNWITVGYVGLVVFVINLMAMVSALTLYDSSSNLIWGERIEATIVDSTINISRNISGIRKRRTMYVPIVRFTAPNGEIITRKGNTGFRKTPVIGDTYVIYYDSERDSLSNFSVTSIAMMMGLAAMTLFLGILSYGTIRYTLGDSMADTKRLLLSCLTLFLFPLAMISANAFIIYAAFFNGPHPLWIYTLLGISIIALTGATLVYVKMIIRKGIRNRSGLA